MNHAPVTPSQPSRSLWLYIGQLVLIGVYLGMELAGLSTTLFLQILCIEAVFTFFFCCVDYWTPEEDNWFYRVFSQPGFLYLSVVFPLSMAAISLFESSYVLKQGYLLGLLATGFYIAYKHVIFPIKQRSK